MIEKIGISTICDFYPCRGRAEFSIGNQFDPMNNLHVCRDCAKKLYRGLGEKLVEGHTTTDKRKKNTENFALFEKVCNSVTNDVLWLMEQREADTPTVSEPYICETCGAEFPRSDEGLKEYKTHRMGHVGKRNKK